MPDHSLVEVRYICCDRERTGVQGRGLVLSAPGRASSSTWGKQWLSPPTESSGISLAAHVSSRSRPGYTRIVSNGFVSHCTELHRPQRVYRHSSRRQHLLARRAHYADFSDGISLGSCTPKRHHLNGRETASPTRRIMRMHHSFRHDYLSTFTFRCHCSAGEGLRLRPIHPLPRGHHHQIRVMSTCRIFTRKQTRAHLPSTPEVSWRMARHWPCRCAGSRAPVWLTVVLMSGSLTTLSSFRSWTLVTFRVTVAEKVPGTTWIPGSARIAVYPTMSMLGVLRRAAPFLAAPAVWPSIPHPHKAKKGGEDAYLLMSSAKAEADGVVIRPDGVIRVSSRGLCSVTATRI